MSDNQSKAPAQPTPSWANPTKPAFGSVGKWERRVWMVCFWATFITAMVQAAMAALFFLATSRADGGSLLSATAGNSAAVQLAFSITSGWGMIIDLVIGVIVAPLGLWAFGRARSGQPFVWPLAIWLVTRVLSGAVVVNSVSVLVAATVVNVTAPWGSRMVPMAPRFAIGVLRTRVGLFELPLWLLVIGLPIVLIERRRVAVLKADSPKQSSSPAVTVNPLN
jgi:hypothetical protein